MRTIRTWLTERFDISHPLIGAPMARAGEGRLAAAVSAAGGLGMVGVGPAATAEWITDQCTTAAEAGRPFGVGLLAWALEQNPAQLDAVAATKASLVSVSFGAFEGAVGSLQDAGFCVTTQVGNLEEALRAEQAGVDFIVARGAEGGGHGRNDVGTLPLLQSVLDRVELPVVAAGGISNARGLAAVIAAGAVGAWVGTAFLTCAESALLREARDRLVAADETGTAYGRVFDVAQRAAWPREYGGRALRNAFFTEWENREQELESTDEIPGRFAEALQQGDFDTAVIYAGQGAGMLTEERTAADVVAEFARAEELLRAAAERRA